MIHSTDRLRTALYALLWLLPLGYIFSQSTKFVPKTAISRLQLAEHARSSTTMGPLEVLAQTPVVAPATVASQPHTTTHETYIDTRDGLRRKAILMLRDNAEGNVVLCHSATFNKESMLPYADKLFAKYNCITFDFRRHGEQNGKQYSTSGKKEIYEVEAAAKFMRDDKRTSNLPVYGFGVSMGAAYLIEAQSQLKLFDGLILQSCFESLRKQIKRQYGFFRIPFMHNLIFREPCLTIAARRHRLKLRKLMPMDSIETVDTPILLIHAKNDDFINFEAFATLQEHGKSIIQTWTPDDGKHTKILEMLPEEYLAQCQQFFATLQRQHTEKHSGA